MQDSAMVLLEDKSSPLSASYLRFVLNLDVSDDTITKRALGRKRSDDTLEVVQERLRAYHAQTAPLIDYYRKKGLLQQVDGEKAPDAVQKDLLDKLSNKK